MVIVVWVLMPRGLFLRGDGNRLIAPSHQSSLRIRKGLMLLGFEFARQLGFEAKNPSKVGQVSIGWSSDLL